MKDQPLFLHEHRNGLTLCEFEEQLSTLVQRVMDAGKAGSITLSFKVTPITDSQVSVTDAITVKEPALEKGKAVYFVDREGLLSRNDPQQYRLPHMDREEVNA